MSGRRGFRPSHDIVLEDVCMGSIFIAPICVGIISRNWVAFGTALGITAVSGFYATCRIIKLGILCARKICVNRRP